MGLDQRPDSIMISLLLKHEVQVYCKSFPLEDIDLLIRRKLHKVEDYINSRGVQAKS